MGLLTTWTIDAPTFGEEQIGVEQDLEATGADTQVNGDDAVVDFAYTVEILPLHAWGLRAFLRQLVSSLTPT